MALAEKAAEYGRAFDQPMFDELWDYAGFDAVARFCSAILIQEGNGSFNTSADNPAADGGNGFEAKWTIDMQRAVNLVRGKLAFYAQAKTQAWAYLCQEVTSPGGGRQGGYPADGGPDQWINWQSAILRPDGSVDIGCYALHASWWVGARRAYLAMGGTMRALTDAAKALDKLAPRVELLCEAVRDQTGLASNWNATAPEPAVVVTGVKIISSARAPEPEKPAVKPVRVEVSIQFASLRKVLKVVPGELREDQHTWLVIGELSIPLRVVAEYLGAAVDYLPDDSGGRLVRLSFRWW